MASYECRDCTANTTAPPGEPPDGWTPQWIEAPHIGPYTFSVRWCCPDCSAELKDFRPPKMLCQHCYEGYAKHPATATWCPDCKADAGSPCVRPSGHNYWQGGVHVEREQLALDKGLMRMCPEGAVARRKDPYVDDLPSAIQAGLVESPTPTLF